MGLEARLVRPFIRADFPPVDAGVLLSDSAGPLDLRAYGIDATARLTPGHTPGSLVVLVEDGTAGRAAIVGDLARGGMMNGRLRAHVPHRHYFHENAQRAEAAVVALLGEGVGRFHVGHGGPIEAAALRRRFASMSLRDEQCGGPLDWDGASRGAGAAIAGSRLHAVENATRMKELRDARSAIPVPERGAFHYACDGGAHGPGRPDRGHA